MSEQTLSLLALDGGGVRGLSSLLILRRLMEAINPDNPPNPCDVFDMIGGTSTGGIIAVMLGRLRMSVDECISQYIQLSDTVFKQTSYFPVRVDGRVKARFDTRALERVIKQTVVSHIHSGASFVCTAASSDMTHTTKLTSYYNPRRSNDLLSTTKIWEAVRATSAASTFFDPIKLGPYGECFTDGATGANNPVRELWTEAGDVWHHLGPLGSSLKCIVSIGTGQSSGVPEFGESLVDVVKALKQLAVETERTAEKFAQEHSHLVEEGRYFRLSVGKGLQGIGLEEASKVPEITAVTRSYLSSEAVADLVGRCANSLRERAAPGLVLVGPTNGGPLYAKTLVDSMRNGMQSYRSMLGSGAFRIRHHARDIFLTTTDLYTDLFVGQRIFTSNSDPSLAVSTSARETAASLVAQLDSVLETASPTLTLTDADFSLIKLTRGAVLTCLRFCLKREIYLRPVATWIGLTLDFMTFLNTFTLEYFPESAAVQAMFLNTYCYLWVASQQVVNFFLDEFGTEIQLSRDIRLERRWRPINDTLSAIQAVVSSDAAFAIHTISAFVPEKAAMLSEIERARGRIIDKIGQMDEAAERERQVRRRDVIRWVSDLEYGETQQALHDTRLEGTGIWLLQTPEFEEWFQGKSSGILWCFGNPGVGKTVLCSAVQDYISREFSGKAEVGFAFVYCTFREPQTPSAYILSYLRQLLSQLPYVPSQVQEKYNNLYGSAKRLSQADIDLPSEKEDQVTACQSLFTYILERFEKVHLAFDALDECDDREKWLLPFICRLVQRYQKNPSSRVHVKLFVTSRLRPDIERAFSKVPTLQVLAKNVDGDIAAYLEHEFQRRSREESIGALHWKLKPRIMHSLTSRANGMFLWVKYQLDIIFEQFTEAGIVETLNDLPETLHGHYDRVLKAIDSQSRPVRELAIDALWCVAGSLRRLHGTELAAAISGFRDPRAGLLPGIDPKGIVQACHNLLVVSPDGTIGFAHYSVLEYFTSEHLQTQESFRLRSYAVDLDDCRFRVTLTCLYCLEGLNLKSGEQPLEQYATEEIANHLRLTEGRHLRKPGFIRLFVKAFRPLQYGSYLRVSASPIQLAAQLGLYEVVTALLEAGEHGGTEDLEGALRFAFMENDGSYGSCQQALLVHGVHMGAASPRIPLPGEDMPFLQLLPRDAGGPEDELERIPGLPSGVLDWTTTGLGIDGVGRGPSLTPMAALTTHKPRRVVNLPYRDSYLGGKTQPEPAQIRTRRPHFQELSSGGSGSDSQIPNIQASEEWQVNRG
ncbi:uncharacterized protein DNG_04645 [Cephalotrichum gorgonifer]|uniref:PNPLA domain-containing protein n=1 Tax=Cephalotrichum gorgonifer TaxID=2041049 RepID=A0AAE8MWR6_9PEZI|nr:uncharacterized protein DNG_04645 [Cephalotrichum gorgonifer]